MERGVESVFKKAHHALANATRICQYRTVARNRDKELNNVVSLPRIVR